MPWKKGKRTNKFYTIPGKKEGRSLSRRKWGRFRKGEKKETIGLEGKKRTVVSVTSVILPKNGRFHSCPLLMSTKKRKLYTIWNASEERKRQAYFSVVLAQKGGGAENVCALFRKIYKIKRGGDTPYTPL